MKMDRVNVYPPTGPEVCMFWNYYNCAQHNRTEYCELNEQPNNDFTGRTRIVVATITAINCYDRYDDREASVTRVS